MYVGVGVDECTCPHLVHCVDYQKEVIFYEFCSLKQISFNKKQNLYINQIKQLPLYNQVKIKFVDCICAL